MEKGCEHEAAAGALKLLALLVQKVQKLLQKEECRYSIYLLYWCKSTNTDAEGSRARDRRGTVWAAELSSTAAA